MIPKRGRGMVGDMRMLPPQKMLPMGGYQEQFLQQREAVKPDSGLARMAKNRAAADARNPRPWLDKAAMATMPVPVLGDVLGAAADVAHYATNDEARTPINFGLSALGLLPFIPGMTHAVDAHVFRGGKKGVPGEFYSRDRGLSEGFDKGELSSKHVKTDKALQFGRSVTLDDAAEVLSAMRAEGDEKAADLLEQVLKEDGEVLAQHFYMMMEQIGSAAPEYYLRKAGVTAIDTGRDLRVLDPGVLR